MKGEKLQMCRICLVEDVRMYYMVNKMELQLLFEKLTGIPFVTEHSRPMLACVFCYTRLKQCCQLQRKCLEAEKLFIQMLNEDDEKKLPINQNGSEFFNGFIITPTVHVEYVPDNCQSKSYDIKVELRDDLKEEYESIEPEEEHHDVKEILLLHCKEENERIKPEQEIQSGASDAKEPELYARLSRLEDTMSFKQKKTEQPDLQISRNTEKHKSAAPSKFTKTVTNSQSISNIMNNTDTAANDRIKTYDCDVCHRRFRRKSNVEKHIRIHSSEKPYKCEICHKSFNQSNTLKIHVRQHTGEKPYKCETCLKSFSRSYYLKSHVLTHTGEPLYKCKICQKSFTVSGNLKKHILIHTGETRYKCEICQKGFNEISHLKYHVRNHTGEKPYKCEICQKSFNQTSHLKIHFRIHTGERPYKCEICQKSFKTNSCLKTHVFIHSDKKPHKCEICQNSFSTTTVLKKHLLKHTKETP